jgi:hypothetical protein
MMHKLSTIPIQLPTPLADALRSVATGGGGSAEQLAAWIVSEWVGKLPVEHTPPHSLATAQRRLAVLQLWWTARKRRGTTEAAATDEIIANARRDRMRVSRTALYEWQQRWEAAGLAGLVDNRKRPLKPVQDPFIDRVKELFRAVRGRRLSTCYREARQEFLARRRKVPSYRSVHRQIRGTQRKSP